jgi:PHS family inorganic phosphate transporter-like MFS transporter
MLLGCFSTLLIKETKRKTLEELADDDDYTVTARSSTHDVSSGEGHGVFEKKGATESV